MNATHKSRNTGRGFEAAIMASQGNLVRLEHLPSCGARFIGKGRIIRLPICCDFVGVMVGTGRAIFFDGKSCELATRFPCGNPDHVPEHQRQFLIRAGEADAISGLLVEAARTRIVYWLDWRYLGRGLASVEWDDPKMYKVAAGGMAISFALVMAASDAAKVWAK